MGTPSAGLLYSCGLGYRAPGADLLLLEFLLYLYLYLYGSYMLIIRALLGGSIFWILPRLRLHPALLAFGERQRVCRAPAALGCPEVHAAPEPWKPLKPRRQKIEIIVHYSTASLDHGMYACIQGLMALLWWFLSLIEDGWVVWDQRKASAEQHPSASV